MPSSHASFFDSAEWMRLLIVALLGYAVFLGLRAAPVPAGSDSSGYLNGARLLTAGAVSTALRKPAGLESAPAAHFTPLGFAPRSDGARIVPTYPVGLSLHLALAAKIGGWFWGLLVISVLSAACAVALTYACARRLGISPPLAAAAAAALAFSPVFLFSAVRPMSDVLATAWCLASVFAALRAPRSRWWAIGCGAAAGIAVIVRPTNVLLLPTLFVLLGNWRAWVNAALGGLPCAIGLGIFQLRLYGSFMRTGYGNVSADFGAMYFAPTFAHYATWLPCVLPLALAFVPLGFVLPWRARARELAALVLWPAAFLTFYAFYRITHETWWYLRFVLPAFPALLLLAGGGLETLTMRFAPARQRVWQLAAAAGAVALSLGAVLWFQRGHTVAPEDPVENAYAEACAWANAHLPADATVACMEFSGAIYFYTEFPVLRYDLLRAPEFGNYAATLRVAGRAPYALLLENEEERALHQHMPGRWQEITRIRNVGIWQLAP